MGGGGDEGRESRFLSNWHHPLPPFSPELPLLFILSFSLPLLYSALLWLARSWWQSARPLCQSQPTPLSPCQLSLFTMQHTTPWPHPMHISYAQQRKHPTLSGKTCSHQRPTTPTTLKCDAGMKTHIYTHMLLMVYIQTFHLTPKETEMVL